MYVDRCLYRRAGRTYVRYLLRRSYREDGKVKHRTLANLSDCSPEEIAAIKLALEHKAQLSVLGSIREVRTRQGLRVGAVWCLKAIAERTGVSAALGKTRQGRLALWQVMARLIGQASRLKAVRLARTHAVCDTLGLEGFTEDHLYDNLRWLSKNQHTIERGLFRSRLGGSPPSLFLYDVSSSYLEGAKNALGAFGYNRDRKQGKLQLVIGLLTDPEGIPVAVRVFEGNTSEGKTVGEQARTLAKRFGGKEVTLVGDRGMLKQAQLDLLEETGFHYITAISKPEIRRLLSAGVLEMGLFDQALGEVEHQGIRYILRRNPQRASEVARNREDKLVALQRLAEEQSQYLCEHPRAKVEVAARRVKRKAEAYKMQGLVEIQQRGRSLCVVRQQEALQEASQLDGCYVIKTDLAPRLASAATVHERYKDLALVERAFRTFKNGHLEVRPVHVRIEPSTRGHVFLVMLAYLLERELDRCWRSLDLTLAEALDELGSLRSTQIMLRGARCHTVPEPTGVAADLLRTAAVTLPQVIPSRGVRVATRKKLLSRRK